MEVLWPRQVSPHAFSLKCLLANDLWEGGWERTDIFDSISAISIAQITLVRQKVGTRNRWIGSFSGCNGGLLSALFNPKQGDRPAPNMYLGCFSIR